MSDQIFHHLYGGMSRALLFYFKKKETYNITGVIEGKRSLKLVFSPDEIKSPKELVQIMIRMFQESLKIISIKVNQMKRTWDVEILQSETENYHREIAKIVQKKSSAYNYFTKTFKDILKLMTKYFSDSVEKSCEIRFQFGSSSPRYTQFYIRVTAFMHWRTRKNSFLSKIIPPDVLLNRFEIDVRLNLKIIPWYLPNWFHLSPEEKIKVDINLSSPAFYGIVGKVSLIPEFVRVVNMYEHYTMRDYHITPIKHKVEGLIKSLEEADRVSPEKVRTFMKMAEEFIRKELREKYSSEELYTMFKEAAKLLETL